MDKFKAHNRNIEQYWTIFMIYTYDIIYNLSYQSLCRPIIWVGYQIRICDWYLKDHVTLRGLKTENRWKFSLAIIGVNYILKYIKIGNSCCFYWIFKSSLCEHKSLPFKNIKKYKIKYWLFHSLFYINTLYYTYVHYLFFFCIKERKS